jgi:DNA-binding MarR family transcriptional regulator
MSIDHVNVDKKQVERDGIIEQVAAYLLEIAPPVARTINVEAQGVEGGCPLTGQQFRMLALVYRGFRLPSELARYMQISPATASETIELLVRRGLIARSDQPGDRRCTLLSLTEEGQKQHNVSIERSGATIKRLLSGLETDKLQALCEGLAALGALMPLKPVEK